MKGLRFTKMHGLGNDFMVINGISQSFTFTPALIRAYSDRHVGIGFDQLLLVEASTDPEVDFFYRIFNANGEEVGQCGNGARCLAKFLQQEKLTTKNELTVATRTTKMKLFLLDNGLVKVDMGAPVFTLEKIPFIANQQAVSYAIDTPLGKLDIGVLSMGNPHCVLLVDNVRDAPVEALGAFFQQCPRFPQGVNVGFLQQLDKTTIALRVYERGVGETLACGSGACAAAVHACLRGWAKAPVEVQVLGGQLLVEWAGNANPVALIGPAVSVFNGVIS